MPQIRAIINGEKDSKEKLGEKCVFIYSIPFWGENPYAEIMANGKIEPESGADKKTEDEIKQENIEKFIAVLNRLKTAFTKVHFLSAGPLNTINFQLKNMVDVETAKSNAKTLEQQQLSHLVCLDEFESLEEFRLDWNELSVDKNFPDTIKFIKDLFIANKIFQAAVISAEVQILPSCWAQVSCARENEEFIRSMIREYIFTECAVTLILRMQVYENIFHIGYVNNATRFIAEHSFTADDFLSAEKINDIIKRFPLLAEIINDNAKNIPLSAEIINDIIKNIPLSAEMINDITKSNRLKIYQIANWKREEKPKQQKSFEEALASEELSEDRIIDSLVVFCKRVIKLNTDLQKKLNQFFISPDITYESKIEMLRQLEKLKSKDPTQQTLEAFCDLAQNDDCATDTAPETQAPSAGRDDDCGPDTVPEKQGSSSGRKATTQPNKHPQTKFFNAVATDSTNSGFQQSPALPTRHRSLTI